MLAVHKEHKSYIDFLRIMAAVLVIYNHTAGYHMFLYDVNSTAELVLCISGSVLTIIDVPVFFMLSGALLLGREETFGKIFKDRIFRFAGVIGAASVVRYTAQVLKDGWSFSIKELIYKIITGQVTEEYWFLYTYIGFLLILPFLRKIAKHMERHDFVLLVGILFISNTLLPIYYYVMDVINWNLPITGNLMLSFAATNIFAYPLAGYYLANKLDVNKINIKQLCLCVLFIVTNVLMTTAVVWKDGITNGFSQKYISLFTYSTAMLVFVVVRWYFERILCLKDNTVLTKVLKTAGSFMMGVYIFDPVLRVVLYYSARNAIDWHPQIESVLWCVFSMTVCSLLTAVLKKIPIVKKYL